MHWEGAALRNGIFRLLPRCLYLALWINNYMMMPLLFCHRCTYGTVDLATCTGRIVDSIRLIHSIQVIVIGVGRRTYHRSTRT